MGQRQTPQIRTRLSVVAYFDLLGTKAKTLKAYADGNEDEHLQELRTILTILHQILAGGTQDWTPPRIPHQWTIRAFTDNLILQYPIPLIDSTPYVGDAEIVTTLSLLSQAQFYLVKSGYLVRGAIAVGPTYVDEQIVFGKAFIDAYLAEENIAVFPRIILTESVLTLITRNLTGYRGHRIHDDWLLRDTDGQVFLNYLDAPILVAEDEAGPWIEALQAHRAAIDTKLDEYDQVRSKGKDDPRVLQKLSWLANYHNSFCDQHDIDTEGCRVVSPSVIGQAGGFRPFRDFDDPSV